VQRSDPFHIDGVDVTPERCRNYRYDSEVTTVPVFDQNLKLVVQDLKDGIDVVFLYCEVIDHIGHLHGPDSEELRENVKASYS
jgi:predicted AlkP superfamily pyrophosphatase or phosphodiesterase